jgi:hypothetical protein
MPVFATTTLLLALLSGPAEAAGPAPEDAPPARIFIERSLVLAPEQAGDFTLVSMNDYPGNPASGVGLRYRHADFPSVRLDLFVYPAGRVDPDEALARGMAEVVSSLEDAAAKGRYAGLELGEVRAFDLARVDTDGSLRPLSAATPEAEVKTEAEAAFLAVVASAIDAEGSSNGRVLDIRMAIDGEPLDSRAFLFYRGLYLYKGRISGSGMALPGDTFERFSQHAMATLVPAIEVRSTGGCSGNTVVLDPDSTPEATQQALITSVLRAKGENCGETLDEAVPEGMRAMPLAYDAAMWGG